MSPSPGEGSLGGVPILYVLCEPGSAFLALRAQSSSSVSRKYKLFE